MQKFSYRIGVVLLITAILFTGCKDTDPVASVGDRDFMPGEYLAAQLDAYYEVYADFSYNSEFLTESYEDGVTATDKITELTDEILKQVAYAEVNFDDAGRSLTEEEQLLFDQNFEYIYLSQEEYYAENGIGEDSFYNYSIALYKFDLIYQGLYYEGGEMAPEIEELAEYYANTYTPITYMEISKQSSDFSPMDETGIAAQKELANEIVEHLEENEDFDAAVEEFMPQVLENTGAVYTEGQPSSYYSTTEVSENSTAFSAEEQQQIAGNAPGSVNVIEQENGFIVYRVEEDYEDISEIEARRDSLTNEIYYEEFEAMAIEEANGYGFSVDSAARSYYNVDRIV